MSWLEEAACQRLLPDPCPWLKPTDVNRDRVLYWFHDGLHALAWIDWALDQLAMWRRQHG